MMTMTTTTEGDAPFSVVKGHALMLLLQLPLLLVLVILGSAVAPTESFSPSTSTLHRRQSNTLTSSSSCLSAVVNNSNNNAQNTEVMSIMFPNKKAGQPLLPDEAYETILQGRIAIIPNFLPNTLASELRSDAQSLFYDGQHFVSDALAAYGKDEKFDPAKDRTVLKLDKWKRMDLGNAALRHEVFGDGIMGRLRTDLARNLNRPKLDEGVSVSAYGRGSSEISYTRFGEGAYLKRHVDEHHEELKGVHGWSKPTRRSISWLVYLNDDWDPDVNGGMIRCFQRKNRPVSSLSLAPVGARPNGDLQIGWLRATPLDPVERPVFLDARRRGPDGICAMYAFFQSPTSSTNNDNDLPPVYITGDFHPQPALFVSGGDFFARKLLVDRADLADRFHYVESPHSPAEKMFSVQNPPSNPYDDERVLDVPPLGGSLVVFDSVSLPHEVLPSRGRDRWAASGWFHEDQQEEAHHYA